VYGSARDPLPSRHRADWQLHGGDLRFRRGQLLVCWPASGDCGKRAAGHTKAVLSVKQHPSLHNMAVSCGEDRLLKIWSLNDGICTRSILCRSKPLDVAFSRDGQCIVSAHYDGSLHVFDASTGSEMRHVDRAHVREAGACVAVVPTAMPFRMASVGRDSIICLTDVYQGQVRSVVSAHNRLVVVGAVCSRANLQVDDGVTHVQVVQRFEHPGLLSVGTQRCTPAVAPDDSVIAIGSSSGLLLLLNMTTGQVESKLSCHTSAISCVAWNTNSELSSVVAGSVDKKGDVVFWRARDEA
jgi:WD40 repeat protein